MRKLYLTHIRSFPIALVILIKMKNLGVLETLIKTQFYHKFELDQFQTLDKLASFPFNEIKLEFECDPDPQPCDSIFIFEFMLIPVSSPNLDQFPEPTFIPVLIDLQIESPYLDSYIPLIKEKCEF